jgi:hypothetical protein
MKMFCETVQVTQFCHGDLFSLLSQAKVFLLFSILIEEGRGGFVYSDHSTDRKGISRLRNSFDLVCK